MRLKHRDKTPSFEEQLEQDEYYSIHTSDLTMLATEVYRNLSPPIFSKLFCQRDIYEVIHGSKSISCLYLKAWYIVPLELKELTSLNAFKKGIKKWQPEDCP